MDLYVNFFLGCYDSIRVEDTFNFYITDYRDRYRPKFSPNTVGPRVPQNIFHFCDLMVSEDSFGQN